MIQSSNIHMRLGDIACGIVCMPNKYVLWRRILGLLLGVDVGQLFTWGVVVWSTLLGPTMVYELEASSTTLQFWDGRVVAC